MASFLMEIAGQVGEIYPLFDSTKIYFQKYLTGKKADFVITVTREALEFEQQDLRREAEEEGMRPRVFTDPFLERTVIQRNFAEHLLTRNTLLLHGSTVAVDGEGYLFTARCGTGKSTHTRFWMQTFGSRAVMVNDDKSFLRLSEAGVLVSGSPWSGKHGLDTNITVPLKGICILERGSENCIRAIKPRDAIQMLLHQSYAPLDKNGYSRYCALVEKIAEEVPLWQMCCTKDPQAASVSYEAMSAGKKNDVSRRQK